MAAKAKTLSHTQQSIYDLMEKTLESWGLKTLGGDLKKMLIQGETGDTLSLALTQTAAYKKRFAGNELRKKAGLPELTPAEYIGVEEQYQQVLRSYGMPKGFYDQHSDFTKLIGSDVSPQELDTRAKIAHDQYTNAPQDMKDIWKRFYGLNAGHAIAAILDPKRATANIQRMADVVNIAEAGKENGFTVTHNMASTAENQGVTLDKARQAFQNIHQTFATDQAIASRFGTTFDSQAEERDQLLGSAADANKRQTLYDEEKEQFNGNSGFTQQSVAPSLNY